MDNLKGKRFWRIGKTLGSAGRGKKEAAKELEVASRGAEVKVTLPVELIRQVVEVFFHEVEMEEVEKLEAFKRLRLVASAFRAATNGAWQPGVDKMATAATRRLLVLSDKAEAFQRNLEEATDVLSQAHVLAVHRRQPAPPARQSGPWITRFNGILATGARIQELSIDLAKDETGLAGALFPLRWQLRSLCISGCRRAQLYELEISHLTTLHTLEMHAAPTSPVTSASGLRCFTVPAGVTSLDLRHLRLSSNELEDMGLDRLQDLRRLNLARCLIDRPLPPFPRLQDLVLNASELDDALLDSILLPFIQLERLDLSGNTRVTSYASFLDLRDNSTLKSLDISLTGVRHPARLGLDANTTLEQLFVGSCSLSSLSFGLSTNTTLVELSLAGCRDITDWTLMRQLSQDLVGNTTLCKLSLHGCDIWDEVISYLTIPINSALRELILSGNNFAGHGLRPLAASLANNTTLELIDLRSCGFLRTSFAWLFQTAGRRVLYDDRP